MRAILMALFFAVFQGCTTISSNQTAVSNLPLDGRAAHTSSARFVHFDSSGKLVLDHQRLHVLSEGKNQSGAQLLSNYLSSQQDIRLKPDDVFYDVISASQGDSADIEYSVALAEYLTVPRFRCRFPLEAAYFDRRYHVQSGELGCKSYLPLRVSSLLSGAYVENIDPDKVREIHLLFAGEGEGWASRFGHVLIRLVICPDKSSSKLECDRNLDEHIVLGFLANIDDFDMSYWKGVMGGYRAYLMAEPFLDVYSRYSIDEFRELYSLPLDLEYLDRKHLLEALVQAHWTFSDDYKFFSKNCATLLRRLLLEALPAFKEDPVIASDTVRPDSFYQNMLQSRFVKASLVNDTSVAETQGYYFPSSQGYYNQALDAVNGMTSEKRYDSLEMFILTSPIDRFELVEQHRDSLRSDLRLRDAYVLLEQYAYLHYQRLLISEFFNLVNEEGLDQLVANMENSVTPDKFAYYDRCFFQYLYNRTGPEIFKSGIPDTGKMNQALVGSGCEQALHGTLAEDLFAVFEELFPDRWQMIQTYQSAMAAAFVNSVRLKRNDF